MKDPMIVYTDNRLGHVVKGQVVGYLSRHDYFDWKKRTSSSYMTRFMPYNPLPEEITDLGQLFGWMREVADKDKTMGGRPFVMIQTGEKTFIARDGDMAGHPKPVLLWIKVELLDRYREARRKFKRVEKQIKEIDKQLAEIPQEGT